MRSLKNAPRIVDEKHRPGKSQSYCLGIAAVLVVHQVGNAVLSRLLEQAADDVRVRGAEDQAPALRGYAETRYGAESWCCKRRVSARIEATALGLEIRCVVTNLRSGSAEWLTTPCIALAAKQRT